MSSVNETIRALEAEVHDEVQSLNQQARSRAFRAVNAMQGAAYDVLGQDGTGRVYRRGAKGVRIVCRIKSDMPYASILENGTARMKARPFRQRIIDQAKPEIVRIFEEVR